MEYNFDFLVIGSGVGGLTFALKAAQHGSVAVITKKGITDTSTEAAQGGVASVFSKLDSFDLHIQDTHAAGDGLCDEEVVEMVVKGGPDRIRELIDMGVQFNLKQEKEGEGEPELSLGREGGHSRQRIVHAQDMTGREIERVLVETVRENDRITVFEDHIAIDLVTYSMRMKRGIVVTSHEEACCGAYVLDANTNEVHTFSGKITLLATGGAGKVYLYTSNPDIATGDGIAMAYRAGARVANLEFVQFHPTCMYHPDAKNFLISEAVRGEGAVLLDSKGNAFMEKYDPQKDLACRDVVARAIDTELKKSGDDSVYLDISHKDAAFVKERFPNIYEKCYSFGVDMTKEPIPVVPAAHYMCGGVATDLDGRTDIARLYVVGETACTGLHGANRLASNSLLEALVYADRASKRAIAELESGALAPYPELLPWDEVGTTDSDEAIMVTANWDEIRRFMWNYVGIVRSNKRLQRAQNRAENIAQEINEYYWDFKITSDLVELRNLALVAKLVIRCAMRRQESRGLHYNIEYPEKNDERWKKNTVLRRPFVN
ncbi:L-aspartate oxidase [Desulfatibacillum alkenivorans DSM 16219]|jgi:L-aspartate oxidase|uniref:L-aspartate oxidase n=1 Tax=Desulfatibacillum alkenivorans DSM 16219 TaxID=1121393 RepID=A0A1M6KGC8_9BACT|nr:L-aspartate oxidase [Desulfatibacillum alkenivorans]SHJ57993.1 L-aspartate oxidase [Desulfatibacillum alkenivorans DSM 16219]